jgi:hypothetical protein
MKARVIFTVKFLQNDQSFNNESKKNLNFLKSVGVRFSLEKEKEFYGHDEYYGQALVEGETISEICKKVNPYFGTIVTPVTDKDSACTVSENAVKNLPNLTNRL